MRLETGTVVAYCAGNIRNIRGFMGRILLGVVIGVILVIWLLVSCVGAIF